MKNRRLATPLLAKRASQSKRKEEGKEALQMPLQKPVNALGRHDLGRDG